MKKLLLLFGTVLMIQAVKAQSVGIGTVSPVSSAQLELASTTKGFLMPRMTTGQRNQIASPVAGLLVYDLDFKENYQFDGFTWRKLLNNTVWNTSPSRNYVFNVTDSIGVGTSVPTEKLHITNGSAYLQDNRTGENPHLIFDVPAVADNEAGLQFKRTGDTLAAVNFVESATVADYLKISVGGTGKANNLTVNTNGELGIGTNNPLGQMHLASYAGDNLVVNDADGTIQFNYPSLGISTKKAFIQLADNEDLRMGTNASNDQGRIIFRTNGTDHMAMSPYGGLGIGTLFPLTRLHIDNGEDAGNSSTTNGFIMLGAAGTGSNLLLDNNEIIVRNGYSTPGTLSIQNDGGEVAIGARTTINKGGEALKINGNDPSINFYENNVQKSYIWQTDNNLNIGISTAAGKVIVNTNQMLLGTSVTVPAEYKLGVGGKIICEELKVKLQSSGWPDYVFDKKYELPALCFIEEYISKNKHLPNIPSATEIEKNGIEVGDMQKRMMEKIEELTLYVIDLQKQVTALKKSDKQ